MQREQGAAGQSATHQAAGETTTDATYPADEVGRLSYTVPEAAVVMGAKVKGVRLLITSGQLGYVRVGNYHLIPRSEIAAFLERNLTRSAS